MKLISQSSAIRLGLFVVRRKANISPGHTRHFAIRGSRSRFARDAADFLRGEGLFPRGNNYSRGNWLRLMSPPRIVFPFGVPEIATCTARDRVIKKHDGVSYTPRGTRRRGGGAKAGTEGAR